MTKITAGTRRIKPTDAVGYYDRDGKWIAGTASGYNDNQGRWIARQSNNNQSDMDMPREIRARLVWLDSYIRAATRDGTLNRTRTNRALRDLNAIRRSERALPRNRDGMLSVRNEAAINLRLDRLSDQLRVSFNQNDRRYWSIKRSGAAPSPLLGAAPGTPCGTAMPRYYRHEAFALARDRL